MADNYLQEVAALTGLTHYPNQGPFGQKEGALIGARDGYLVAIGPAKTESGSAIGILICYPAAPDAKAIETEIKAAKPKEGKHGGVTDSGVQWLLHYTFKKPKAQEVVEATDALITTLKKVAPGYNGTCQMCKSARVSEILLMNSVPGYYCDSCQQQMHSELANTAQNYEQIQANFPNALALGLVAALIGSALWGGLAYAINRIFLVGAIGIGVVVTMAVIKGMGKTNLAAQVMAAVLTVGSVLLGDALFFVLVIMKETGAAFSTELVSAVLQNFVQLETDSGGGWATILFALVGAGYAIYQGRKPQFKAQFERLGQPAS